MPPTTTITNPLPNSNAAVNHPINLTAHVEDDGPVDRVEFLYANNGGYTLIGTDTTADANGDYSVPFTPTVEGVYGIYAVAYDTGGLRGDAQDATLSVINEPPQVYWVSPANGATFTVPPKYTVQPSEPGYQFFPPGVTFNGLSQSETSDFTAAGPLPDPGPTPTPAVNIAWQNFYDGPQHQADLNPHVAVDTQGNAYVTGVA